MEWWEEAFIGLGNGIQDFGNGVKKGVETVVENTVNSVVSFTEFVRDFVNDPIGATANVLSAMWDTIKDPKFWALTTTSVLVGLGIASCGSIPVGILVTCIATSAVGEAYDLCIVHKFNLDSFFASRGCKTLMEYIGKQIIVMGADGLKGYLSGKVIERFIKGKGSSSNKLPDNDLIEDISKDNFSTDIVEDSIQDAIDDGIDGVNNYEYSQSVTNKTDLYHNFPRMLDEYILENPVMYRPDGRIEYVARGYISDKEGAFHITTKGNRIIHRSFFEVKEWNKFIKNKDLPSFDQLPHLKKGE